MMRGRVLAALDSPVVREVAKWSSIPLSCGESPRGLDPRVAAAELPDPQHQHRHQPPGG